MFFPLCSRAHSGLDPSATQFAHLLNCCKSLDEFTTSPKLAWSYTTLAAERGVQAAAAALAHGYSTAQGLAAGVLDKPCPAKALEWLRKALRGKGEGVGSDEEGKEGEEEELRLRLPSVAGGKVVEVRTGVGQEGNVRCWEACLRHVVDMAEEEAQVRGGGGGRGGRGGMEDTGGGVVGWGGGAGR